MVRYFILGNFFSEKLGVRVGERKIGEEGGKYYCGNWGLVFLGILREIM